MKMTKKLISLVLAIMMVVTAFPITVFADGLSAENDADVVVLKNAISEYEQIMDGSTIYKNMSPAYEAYVNANVGLDAYVYGGDSSINLRNLANDLVTKTTTMRTAEWKASTGTKRGSFANDGDGFNTDQYYSEVYRNLLWVKQGMTENDYEWDAVYPAGDRDDYTAEMSYGIKDVTMLYDGITKPRFGTTIRLWGQTKPNWTWNWKNLRLHYAYITPNMESTAVNKNGLQFINAWHGKDGRSENFQWNYFADGHNPGACTISEQTQTYFNEMNQMVIANIMEYSPTSANPFGDSLMLTINPCLYYNMGYDSANASYHYQYKATIRIFNYKAVVSAIESKQSLLKSIKSYKQGGLSTVFKLYDTLTVDPNSFFTSSNNYAACEDHYTEPVSTLGGITANDLTKDDAQYQSLRDAITKTDATAKLPESEQKKFTEESWSAFATAYANAQAFAANIKNVKYTDGAQADALATALNEAYDNLEILYVACDVVDLTGAVDDGLVATINPSYFTNDSFTASNLEVNVPLAQKAVWGSVENYGIKNQVLPWSEDNQAIVDQWTETVGEGVARLVVNKDKVLASAGMESLNSALAKAKTYKAEDYSNYSVLSAAIYNAENFEERVIADTSDTSKLSSGMVTRKLEEYTTVVEDLYSAMRNLRPAFSKIKNGTFASSIDVRDDLQHSPPNSTGALWILRWDHTNDNIIFRTTHEAVDYDLGKSNFEWNCSRMYDQYLETLNFNSNPDFSSGEITTDADLPADKLPDYVGNLEVNANGATYKWSNFVVTAYNVTPDNGYVGKDSNLNGYTLESKKVWDDELLIPLASYKNPGSGIIVHGDDKKGSTYFTSDTTLSLDATQKKTLSASTRPSLKDCTQKGWWGTYFFWEYKPFWHYAGLAFMQEPYELRTSVVDVSYLFELIDQCNTYTYKNYTDESWNDFTDALTAANSEMNYGSMAAGQILKECQTRYDNLWQAKNNLVEAATNDVIDEALVTARTIKANYDLRLAHYSPASYAVFTTAMNNAIDAINGEYSDAKCRNLLKDEAQDQIDAIAKALTDAIDALVPSADFTKIDEAVATKIMDKKFKVEDLEALNETLGKLTYLPMTKEERYEVYADDQAKVDAEAEAITDLILNLVETEPVDQSTLEAAKELIDAEVSDPDAYEGVQAAKDFIDEAIKDENRFAEVDVYGQKVIGVKYSQGQTDKIVEEALTKLTAKTYNVYVKTDDDEFFVNQGSFAYGAEFTKVFDSEVDIYTSFTSVSSEGAYKYLTTDNKISFVVKGDTYITARSASKQSSYKVTIINALTNRVDAIDYVDPMVGKFTLPETKQIAYYDFAGYTVNGNTKTAGDVIDITGDTYIFANYDLQESGSFSVMLYYDASESTGDDALEISELELEADYNNKIVITEEGLKNHVPAGSGKYEGAYVYVEDEKIADKPSRNATCVAEDREIAAYAVLDASYDVDSFMEMYADYYQGYDVLEAKRVFSDACADFPGALQIVSYDEDYSFFVSGNMVVVALSDIEVELATEAGLIDTDANGADITVINPVSFVGKSSIITTYAVPAGAKYVEGGILFATDVTVNDFTFSKVDNSKLFRLKSTEQTVGNQFVINIVKSTTPRQVKYASYVIYEINGKQTTIFTNPVVATITAEQA